MSTQPHEPDRAAVRTSVSDVVDIVRDYAKQETIGPLRGAGRWLGFGAVGAALIGVGLLLVLLGVLRLLQTEWPEVFDGAWAWVPHLIVGLLAVAMVALAVRRVARSTLGKEPEL